MFRACYETKLSIIQLLLVDFNLERSAVYQLLQITNPHPNLYQIRNKGGIFALRLSKTQLSAGAIISDEAIESFRITLHRI